jgi:hypothetical protein
VASAKSASAGLADLLSEAGQRHWWRPTGDDRDAEFTGDERLYVAPDGVQDLIWFDLLPDVVRQLVASRLLP